MKDFIEDNKKSICISMIVIAFVLTIVILIYQSFFVKTTNYNLGFREAVKSVEMSNNPELKKREERFNQLLHKKESLEQQLLFYQQKQYLSREDSTQVELLINEYISLKDEFKKD